MKKDTRWIIKIIILVILGLAAFFVWGRFHRGLEEDSLRSYLTDLSESKKVTTEPLKFIVGIKKVIVSSKKCSSYPKKEDSVTAEELMTWIKEVQIKLKEEKKKEIWLKKGDSFMRISITVSKLPRDIR
ncbi:MAG TPA: hypothetical protein ENF20_09160 [Candidatus Marinimicrobia bacterium]|nr:hypothetical protein [Candidatus Neomarinimicrobiota bacterium]